MIPPDLIGACCGSGGTSVGPDVSFPGTLEALGVRRAWSLSRAWSLKRWHRPDRAALGASPTYIVLNAWRGEPGVDRDPDGWPTEGRQRRLALKRDATYSPAALGLGTLARLAPWPSETR